MHRQIACIRCVYVHIDIWGVCVCSEIGFAWKGCRPYSRSPDPSMASWPGHHFPIISHGLLLICKVLLWPARFYWIFLFLNCFWVFSQWNWQSIDLKTYWCISICTLFDFITICRLFTCNHSLRPWQYTRWQYTRGRHTLDPRKRTSPIWQSEI